MCYEQWWIKCLLLVWFHGLCFALIWPRCWVRVKLSNNQLTIKTGQRQLAALSSNVIIFQQAKFISPVRIHFQRNGWQIDLNDKIWTEALVRTRLTSSIKLQSYSLLSQATILKRGGMKLIHYTKPLRCLRTLKRNEWIHFMWLRSHACGYLEFVCRCYTICQDLIEILTACRLP